MITRCIIVAALYSLYRRYTFHVKQGNIAGMEEKVTTAEIVQSMVERAQMQIARIDAYCTKNYFWPRSEDEVMTRSVRTLSEVLVTMFNGMMTPLNDDEMDDLSLVVYSHVTEQFRNWIASGLRREKFVTHVPMLFDGPAHS